MVKTTREQRVSLKRIRDRHCPDERYRDFRKRVEPVFFGGGAIIVQVPGMWIGIEPDGYSHT